jgi:PAS domain S-box-containing protein
MIKEVDIFNALNLVNIGILHWKISRESAKVEFFNYVTRALFNLNDEDRGSEYLKKELLNIFEFENESDLYISLKENKFHTFFNYTYNDDNIVFNFNIKSSIIEEDEVFTVISFFELNELTESNFLKVVFDNTPLLMAIASADTRKIIDVNTAWLNTFDFTKEYVIGKSIKDLGIMNTPEFDNFNKLIFENSSLKNVEMHLFNRNGKKHILLFSLEKVTYNGKDYYLTSAGDITDKIEKELVFKASEDKLKFALANLKIVLFFQNSDFTYSWVYSPYFKNLQSEVLPPTRIFSETDEIRHTEIKKSLIKLKEHQTGTEYVVLDDQTRFIEWDYSPRFSSEGLLTGISGFIRDISSEKESEVKLNTIYDTLPIGVAVIDNNGIIIEVNRQLVNFIHSITNEFLPYDKLIESISDQKNLLMSIIEYQAKQSIESKSAISEVEIDLISKSGNHLWFSVSSAPISPSFNVAVVIVTDITYKKTIETEIKRSNNQLRKISDYMESIREEERKKVAFWIHDDIGQIFTGLKIDLTWLENKFKAASKEIPTDRFDSMHKTIDETIMRVREISTNLRPPVLDHFGICVALEFQIQDLGFRSGFNVIFNKNITEIEFNEDRKIALFRIMQEFFINIVRHSQATEVELTITKDFDTMIIDLYDNGVGFPTDVLSSPKSFGLMAVQERLRSLKGSVEYFLSKGEGTRINIKIPL